MIRLYKAGDTHVVRGVKCIARNFDEYSFKHLLDAGWHLRPEEIENGVQIKNESDSKEGPQKEGPEKQEEKDLLAAIETASIKELRILCKKLKVHYSKRVKIGNGRATKIVLFKKAELKNKLLEKVNHDDQS